MDHSQVKEGYKHNFSRVKNMHVALLKFPSPKLSENDFNTIDIDIDVSDFAFDHDASKQPGNLDFAAPYPKDDFESLYKDNPEVPFPHSRDPYDFYATFQLCDYLSHSLQPTVEDVDLFTANNWAVRCVNSSPFENLFCFRRWRAMWQVCGIWEPKNKVYPHIACAVKNETVADEDTLLRSELVCATGLMAERLYMRFYYPNHRYVPVFVYSFSARKVRIIQAHYDAPKLVIRKTKLIDFEEENPANVKMMLRWMMSMPMGDTKWPKASGDPPANPLPMRVAALKG